VINKKPGLIDKGKETEKPEPRTQQQQQQQALSLIEPPTSPLHGKIQRNTHDRRFLVLTLWVRM
jgi:hypothetical protein